MKKKLLITGASGMLGKEFLKLLSFDYLVYTVGRSSIKTSKNHYLIDITEEDSLKQVLDLINPEIIIHCAANVNINDCEANYENAYSLHVNSTKVLSSHPTTDKFIYISTDSVFDGTKSNYIETDTVNPLNNYSKTKAKGEEIVLTFAKNPYIIRTNIIGFSPGLGNSFFEWGFNELRNSANIKGFNDVFFNPLYTKDLADKVNELLSLNIPKGIYNFSSSSSISKYHFLIEIAKEFNFDIKLIQSISIDALNFGIKRPKNTTLNNAKASNNGIVFPSIQQTIENLFKDFKKRTNA
ncbi:MAG: SDR family oxidoreductase [Crocinitomicaceae bacterium]|nr:SDR family oxidoreductase [Crocinitomicaceae bacterium]